VQSVFASPGRLRGGHRSGAGWCTSVLSVLARLVQFGLRPARTPLSARDVLGDRSIGERPPRRAERYRLPRTEASDGLSFNAMNTPSIGAPSAGAAHTLDRRGCLRNWHSQNQRRKRCPAARAEAVAFAPTLDLIVAATTAVTIGWKVGEACVRISPAVAVNPGVSPGEARRSRRSSRTGKTSAGNRHCQVISDVPHEVDPLRKSRRTESNLTSKAPFRSSSEPAGAFPC
jgi:hypothetical protein